MCMIVYSGVATDELVAQRIGESYRDVHDVQQQNQHGERQCVRQGTIVIKYRDI
jgi:hypothetical protein